MLYHTIQQSIIMLCVKLAPLPNTMIKLSSEAPQPSKSALRLRKSVAAARLPEDQVHPINRDVTNHLRWQVTELCKDFEALRAENLKLINTNAQLEAENARLKAALLKATSCFPK